MKFTKYEKYGPYHWYFYEQGTKYKGHVDRIVEWVKEKYLLDIGAGDGLISAKLRDAGHEVTSIDDEPSAVKCAQDRGVNVIQMDARHLLFQPDSFEAVLMIDVLEHFEKPLMALNEAKRVSSGPLYIVTPPKRDDGKLTDKFHYVEWTPDELKALVESVGYKLEGEIKVMTEEKFMYAKFVQ